MAYSIMYGTRRFVRPENTVETRRLARAQGISNITRETRYLTCKAGQLYAVPGGKFATRAQLDAAFGTPIVIEQESPYPSVEEEKRNDELHSSC